MRWQRNMFQMKEQDKTPEEQLSDVEVGNLPEKEFRVVIVKMIQELRKRIDAQSEKLLVTDTLGVSDWIQGFKWYHLTYTTLNKSLWSGEGRGPTGHVLYPRSRDGVSVPGCQ